MVETPGLVCAHHHLYSALARGMPAPHRVPTTFADILELVWWRLDRALDLDTIHWSAMLGALEALEAGTTAIVSGAHRISRLCRTCRNTKYVGCATGRSLA